MRDMQLCIVLHLPRNPAKVTDLVAAVLGLFNPLGLSLVGHHKIGPRRPPQRIIFQSGRISASQVLVLSQLSSACTADRSPASNPHPFSAASRGRTAYHVISLPFLMLVRCQEAYAYGTTLICPRIWVTGWTCAATLIMVFTCRLRTVTAKHMVLANLASLSAPIRSSLLIQLYE
jgi:hypothetical protein